MRVAASLSGLGAPSAQCQTLASYNPFNPLFYSCFGSGVANVYQKVEYGPVPQPVNGTIPTLTQTQIDAMSPSEIQTALAQGQIQDTAAQTDAALNAAIANGTYDPNGTGNTLGFGIAGLLTLLAVGFFAFEAVKR